MKDILMERIFVGRTFDTRAILPIFRHFTLFSGQNAHFYLKKGVKCQNIGNIAQMSKVLPTSIRSVYLFFIAKTFTPTIIFNLREFEKKLTPPMFLHFHSDPPRITSWGGGVKITKKKDYVISGRPLRELGFFFSKLQYVPMFLKNHANSIGFQVEILSQSSRFSYFRLA